MIWSYNFGFLSFLLAVFHWSLNSPASSWNSSPLPLSMSVSKKASHAAQASNWSPRPPSRKTWFFPKPKSPAGGHWVADLPMTPNMSPQEADPGVLDPSASLPRSQLDLARAPPPTKGPIAVLDQTSLSFSLWTRAYFTRGLQQSFWKWFPLTSCCWGAENWFETRFQMYF